MFTKYTAHLQLGDHRTVSTSSDNLQKLTLATLHMLDEFGGIVNGTIQDNQTGHIIHRCNKSHKVF